MFLPFLNNLSYFLRSGDRQPYFLPKGFSFSFLAYTNCVYKYLCTSVSARKDMTSCNACFSVQLCIKTCWHPIVSLCVPVLPLCSLVSLKKSEITLRTCQCMHALICVSMSIYCVHSQPSMLGWSLCLFHIILFVKHGECVNKNQVDVYNTTHYFSTT